MKKTGEIKELFNTADIELLLKLIEEYRDDERLGVQKIIESAEKQIKKYEDEKQLMYEMFTYEREHSGCEYICGIDEVGRGPLAGPVVAAAVILPKDCDILYINDSKKLSAKKREELSMEIKEKAVSYGIGFSSNQRIDEINILNATYEAMREAINNLSQKPDILLNDAVTIPGVKIPQVPIIKGDAKSASIAAASIIAKVYRDHLMEEEDLKYPGYGFSANKGYGSKEHIEALKAKGPSEIHRRSFISGIIDLTHEY